MPSLYKISALSLSIRIVSKFCLSSHFRGVELTSQLHPAPRLGLRGAIPPLPHIYSWNGAYLSIGKIRLHGVINRVVMDRIPFFRWAMLPTFSGFYNPEDQEIIEAIHFPPFSPPPPPAAAGLVQSVQRLGYEVDNRVSILGRGNDGIFSLRRRVQIGSGANPAPIQWIFLPGSKAAGRESDHSPPSRAKVKNAWSFTSTPHTCSWHSAYSSTGTTLPLPLPSPSSSHTLNIS
jgi:hypothetical protein